MSDNFDDIISFENLYKAHRTARLGKRHKKEVVMFEANLAQNLWQLHYDLKYKRYAPGGYRKFMIYDPKEREIQAISYRDRIVQHSLCDNFLTPLLERRLIYDNAACRKNKGSGFAVKRLKTFMAKHYAKYGSGGYFVKLDVHKYFNSIDHKILKQILAALVSNKDVLWLIYVIIDSFEYSNGKGLPMGNQTSQSFGLLYLDKIDRFIKEKLRVKYYLRYMDDMVMLVPDKRAAQICINGVTARARELKICLNSKSQAVAAKNGIEFLGWRFFYAPSGAIVRKLRRSTKKRIVAKLKYKIALDGRHFDRTATLASYRGLMKGSDSFLFLNKVKNILK